MINSATTPVIEMKGVGVSALYRPDLTVLEQVDWQVAAGDYWVVAGLHRSGKSDLLMLTAGLLSPLCGSYRLFGAPMPIFEGENFPTRLRAGFVFDDGHVLNNLTVAENIALPLRYHENLSGDELAERVGQLLKITELSPWANNTPGVLGRNWRKRVGLARALALRPELLLVDNPLGGLDVRDAGWWLDFLAQLSVGHDYMPDKRPATLVVTADDVRPWRDRAKQFAVLRAGRFETAVYDL